MTKISPAGNSGHLKPGMPGASLKTMSDRETKTKTSKPTRKMGDPTSAVYGLGLIGALIYFIQHATGFWMGALGVLKALVWPVFVIYKLLEHLQA